MQKEAGTFKYFLKIVPTEYVSLRGELPVAAHAQLASLQKFGRSSVQ